MAGALKIWDGTTWQTVSQQGPPGTAPVTSVDARTGAVTLSDLYVAKPGVTSVDGRTGAVSLSDRYLSATNPPMQAGTSTQTTDANGQYVVYFPTAFLNVPSVVVTGATLANAVMEVGTVTTTYFVLTVWRYDNVRFAGASYKINWIAM